MADLLSNTEFLCGLCGKRVVSVHRQLFVEDYNYFNPATRDQESDGPVEFLLDDNTVFHLRNNMDEMAIDVYEGPMPQFGSSFHPNRDISSNEFWSRRIGKRISAVDVLQSVYEPEDTLSGFGLEIFLDGADSFLAENAIDSDHDNQLILSEVYAGPPYRRVRLCGERSHIHKHPPGRRFKWMLKTLRDALFPAK